MNINDMIINDGFENDIGEITVWFTVPKSWLYIYDKLVGTIDSISNDNILEGEVGITYNRDTLDISEITIAPVFSNGDESWVDDIYDASQLFTDKEINKILSMAINYYRENKLCTN